MKGMGAVRLGLLLQRSARVRAASSPYRYPNKEAPLRSELFNADQMEQHGKLLASKHKLAQGRTKSSLLARLAENERVLIDVCNLLTSAVAANQRATPAGEWLLDNFYLIEEQIRTAKRHFPKGYNRELPSLADGPSAGLPRVYDIALEAIAHGDGRLGPGRLRRFVAAYQSIQPLTLGELWAIPIMLRLALIENLRRVATLIASGRLDRNHARYWADQMVEIADKDPKSLILLTADMARSKPPMTSSFVSEIARRLQGQSPALALPLTWIEQWLAESGLTIEQSVQSGNQQQAADQVSISNSIGSLRALGAINWNDFVESLSLVEQTLREDPDASYPKMDFATRDRYRHVVEKVAKKCELTEFDVAQAVLRLARSASALGQGERATHVGYYLLEEEGLIRLDQVLRPASTVRKFSRRTVNRWPTFFYVGGVLLLSVVFSTLILTWAPKSGLSGWGVAALMLLTLLASSQPALEFVNWLATLWTRPHLLPRLDFSEGIPKSASCLVVVPTILFNDQYIDELVEALEVRFLANRDENLYFALLTDFRDSYTELLPEDEFLLQSARAKIETLNEKYQSTGKKPFFLFQRPRRWNAADGIWMGYERKRGKLADLNAYLRGGSTTGFLSIVGETENLRHIKYVITLDTDTQLPRDAARQFVGTMAHPLNRAHYDDERQRVCQGYGILQPRVSMSLAGIDRSYYSQLFGGEPGIDPYTRAVSDVYQDVFKEGSFIGKGIYDVDAFEAALKDRFPENRILSHDLLEGCYVRSGLLSDVQLYEESPAHYLVDVRRRHRWVRGDWQLLPWIFSSVPGLKQHSRYRNPLSLLSRWKLFDNLRRSLVAPAWAALLLMSWSLWPATSFWTWAVLSLLLAPSVTISIWELLRKPSNVLLMSHITGSLQASARRLGQVAFTFACLPYEAFFNFDAILRTLWRMWVSHKGLLEWLSFRESNGKDRYDLFNSFRVMWVAPVVAISTTAYLIVRAPQALLIAAPILFLWTIAPGLANWISLPRARREPELSTDQLLFLRKIARRTWAFFETYVGADDHWLPPDNCQEYRGTMVAHRTSPTNIGMALLANLSAYDFGYLPAAGLIARTQNTFQTLHTLERHQGHFYNWYDTQSLRPLLPIYISSVDSGNLAGHLLTLRAGLLAIPDEPVIATRWLNGIEDTLEVLLESLGGAVTAPFVQFQKYLATLRALPPRSLTGVRQSLERLITSATELVTHTAMATASQAMANQAASEKNRDRTASSSLRHNNANPIASEMSAKKWAERLVHQCQTCLNELTAFMPWALLPFAQRMANDFPELNSIFSLRELLSSEAEWLSVWQQRLAAETTARAREQMTQLIKLLAQGCRRAREQIEGIESLAQQAGQLADMQYGFLYDKTRHLLAIGYNVDERRRDTSHYDLLASEARFSCFVGIAQGQLPQESWFALGRTLTAAAGHSVLFSWSGSMFEYLMPQLVMPSYENTLLDQTCKVAVTRQIEYGSERNVPWGISESGYNTVDVHFNYQYRAFGVPGLGLKRGLGEDLVVAPYASALALMVMPEAAVLNLQRLANMGLLSEYGFYEAIDYTPSRQRRGESSTIVRSYMAHHQGMSLLSLAYLLLDRPMQKRFVSDPQFQATLMLLQEGIPKVTAFSVPTAALPDLRVETEAPVTSMRVYKSVDTPTPEVQLLSNGRYHVMLSNAGGGYSRWKGYAVTRWQEDPTRDNAGSFCYLQDVTSGSYWSAAYQPTLRSPNHYEAIFTEGRAEFRRRDLDFDTHLDIVVSPEDDIELRRLRVVNRSRTRRTIEITSYAEVVLAPAMTDALHPAFSNLFVQTEIVPARQTILCTRRPRSPDEHTPWMLHLMAAHGAHIETISYETDRMRFLGRGNSPVDPQALRVAGPLSGGQGSVLDPIVAVRCRLTLDPEQSVILDMVTGMSETREEALSLADKYQDRRLADRVFELANTHAHVVLSQINATEADAQLYCRLASSVLYANAVLRAEPATLIKNRRGQSGLWGYAISGDLPIVLLQIADPAHIDLVRQLLQAHAYWRLKGLSVDLLIWNEEHAGYRQLLQEHIMGLVAAGGEANIIDRPGGVFVRPGEQISHEDRILLQTVARVIIADNLGPMTEQLDRRAPPEMRIPLLKPTRAYRAGSPSSKKTRGLILFNGLGGFTPDGSEYVITTGSGQTTPLPWVNILANPQFGSVISESGLAYTWSENAHEFRLTPWYNDPVSDSQGEAIYIRDEESGHFWSPTSLPCPGNGPYLTRHGFGYSVFEHDEDGIATELAVYVALEAPVKFQVLKLRNTSKRPRQISITAYIEWVLGDLRSKSAMHVVTELNTKSGALFARNPYNTEFGERVAFFDMDEATRVVSGDRTEFLGRNGTFKNPAAMMRTRLSGRVGAGLDPCGALQTSVTLAAGEEREIRILLGMGRNHEEAERLVVAHRGTSAARAALQQLRRSWTQTLGAVQVQTPDPSLNVLANGWLIYQTLACRLWARSGYYQSGGAFGFRDQLQDCMALTHTEPQRLRQQILLCASRQFLEGDVQHWWHPPSGRGVRTRCSDDYLWLPLATCRYVFATGDSSILDENIHFLEGRAVNMDEDSYYDLPNRSDLSANLYEHCTRACLHGLRFGVHGLPLMGTGDWNDGMNLVGEHGQGESVWLGFFLYHVLLEFTELARGRSDTTVAEHFQNSAVELRRNLERHGWDGEWYRRAYFDDGTALGSAENAECQIDSIAQSWSVLSAAGDAGRARSAMESLDQHLVKRDSGIIQLLDPPFDKSPMNPGYIKGYVPGVRENGGQYTHAAVWTVMAFAALGNNRRAWELVNMINPVRRASTPQGMMTYKVEPYVAAADVYAVSPHTGRGGWTWYTGSAGWMYRLIVESLLGVHLEVDKLHIKACLPDEWPGFTLRYRYRATAYFIEVVRRDVEETRIQLDGILLPEAVIPLVDDQQEHRVEVRMPKLSKNPPQAVVVQT